MSFDYVIVGGGSGVARAAGLSLERKRVRRLYDCKGKEHAHVAAPTIDPDFLAKDTDLSTLIKGVKMSREIVHTLPKAAFEYSERYSVHDGMTDVDWERRVRGLQAVRVVDASVMPAVTRGNANAPTGMITERAAKFIKADAAQAVVAG